MKNIIKKLLRESLLDEGMLTLNNLPSGTGLFNNNHDGVRIYLYNPESNISFGVLTAYLRHNNYSINTVAAEKGFGPYMYELAMMYASLKGKGLSPDRTGEIRSDAWNIWLKFNQRSDVKKTPIIPFNQNGEMNKDYSVSFLTGDETSFEDSFENDIEFKEYWDSLSPDDKNTLNIYNTVYSMQPSNAFRTLVSIADSYIKKGFDVNKAFSSGRKLFFSKYD